MPMPPVSAHEPPWHELWRHRPRLVALAAARLRDPDAAEDLVSDVLVQVATDPPPDVQRWEAWLTTVVVRRCHDVHRARAREEGVLARCLPLPPDRHDDAVCDAAAARYARGRTHELPPAQRYALEALIAGEGVETIAAGLGRSPKAAEGLVSRMRARVRPWLGVAVGCAALRRRVPHGTVALVTAAAVAGVTLFLGPGFAGWPADPVQAIAGVPH